VQHETWVVVNVCDMIWRWGFGLLVSKEGQAVSVLRWSRVGTGSVTYGVKYMRWFGNASCMVCHHVLECVMLVMDVCVQKEHCFV
jgi:hypothetical protein